MEALLGREPIKRTPNPGRFESHSRLLEKFLSSASKNMGVSSPVY
jgi:hypothetical protein